jgi:diguanylate cyclase (GGDEF)-like protein
MARANRARRFIGVMFLDLDRFKNVNDSLGHDSGDLLLKAVADRLSHCIRDGDTIARLGGDEFIFILDNIAQPEDTPLVAQKILLAFSSPFYLKERELFISASIGISVFPTDGQDSETLLKNADTAMYRAKEWGKNQFQLYSPVLN